MYKSLHRREPGGADTTLHHASLAIDEFEFYKTQQISNVILTFARRLDGDFLVFPQNGRQLELPQMMREEQLWRRGTSWPTVVMPPPWKGARDNRPARWS